jgi:hypothetical protein
VLDDGERAAWVFGYGSLVAPASVAETLGWTPQVGRTFLPARLRGVRRVWNVSAPACVPGGFVHRWPDGRPLEGTVCFLGIRPASPVDAINGALVAVSPQDLQALDRRERRYRRIEVTRRVVADGTMGVPVYTYLPLASAVALNRASRAAGRDHRTRRYVDLVSAAFAALGVDALEEYHATTEETSAPVVDVIRDRDTSPTGAQEAAAPSSASEIPARARSGRSGSSTAQTTAPAMNAAPTQ